MNKILIIGQAPALKKQTVPYDTTLLYTMLEWVGISKDQAQIMFEFEALSNEFPGLSKPGHHAKPSNKSIANHWVDKLQSKVLEADKIWLLGTFTQSTFNKLFITDGKIRSILETYHPSRRNYSKIMAKKEELTQQIKAFLTY